MHRIVETPGYKQPTVGGRGLCRSRVVPSRYGAGHLEAGVREPGLWRQTLAQRRPREKPGRAGSTNHWRGGGLARVGEKAQKSSLKKGPGFSHHTSQRGRLSHTQTPSHLKRTVICIVLPIFIVARALETQVPHSEDPEKTIPLLHAATTAFTVHKGAITATTALLRLVLAPSTEKGAKRGCFGQEDVFQGRPFLVRAKTR